MCSLFRNKYRSESDRLQGYNYARSAAYYVTIVTKDRIQYFGSVTKGEIILTDLGSMLRNEWLKTPQIRPDMHIILDEFVIMPDHFHAIIIIGENQYNTHNENSNVPGYAMHCVSQSVSGRKSAIKNKYHNRFGPQSKNLSSIIRGFKSAITTNARKNNLEFRWQNRFYDHIICSDKELQKIRKYIIDNPSKWGNND